MSRAGMPLRRAIAPLTIALASLVLASGSAAGTGVGATFDLGETNFVNAQSILAGNFDGTQLLVANQSAGASAFGLIAFLHSATHGAVVAVNDNGGPALELNTNAGTAPIKLNGGVAKVTNLDADKLDGLDSSRYWQEGGNSGFNSLELGTTDYATLNLVVDDRRALGLNPGDGESPNLVGGCFCNRFEQTSGSHGIGQTIGGGGSREDFTNDPGPNVVHGDFSTVGGGEGNEAGSWGFVGGGFDNVTTGNKGAIGGGTGNVASGFAATVGGGDSNTASAANSTIGGGEDNIASSLWSTVVGGKGNTASGQSSLAAGRAAKAVNQGAFVWGGGNAVSISSTAANQFTARATGGVRFISAIHPGTGAIEAGVQLAAGANSWTTLSDRSAKRELRPVDGAALLRSLAGIPMATWSYKTQAASIRHMGPMAQDFRKAFGLGLDEKHIDTVDADGVSLAAIQALYKQSVRQQRQIAALQREVARLKAR